MKIDDPFPTPRVVTLVWTILFAQVLIFSLQDFPSHEIPYLLFMIAAVILLSTIPYTLAFRMPRSGKRESIASLIILTSIGLHPIPWWLLLNNLVDFSDFLNIISIHLLVIPCVLLFLPSCRNALIGFGVLLLPFVFHCVAMWIMFSGISGDL